MNRDDGCEGACVSCGEEGQVRREAPAASGRVLEDPGGGRRQRGVEAVPEHPARPARRLGAAHGQEHHDEALRQHLRSHHSQRRRSQPPPSPRRTAFFFPRLLWVFGSSFGFMFLSVLVDDINKMK